MTTRALFLGLTVALFICGFGYFCFGVVKPPVLLVPNLMPPVVFGGLVLFSVTVNPLLRRLRPGLCLSGKEVAAACAIALAACSVPYIGLVHVLPGALMLPHHYNRLEPGWREAEVLDLVPERMLADPSVAPETALDGFVTGLAANQSVGFFEIPWSAWSRALWFWVPVALTLSLCSLALAVILNRQWARHELLPYPLTTVARSILPGAEGEASPVFRSKAFWWAAGIVFAIHLNNTLYQWFPNVLINIPLVFDFTPLAQYFPCILAGRGGGLFRPGLIFSVVGIGYFFRKEVALTVAATPWVMCHLIGCLVGYGVIKSGFNLFDGPKVGIYLGGYAGIFLILAYAGRHHYLQVFKQSLGLSPPEPSEVGQVWAGRALLVLSAVFVVQLWAVGVPLYFAALFLLVSVVVLTVICRAIAETGAVYVGTWIIPCAVILNFFGHRAIGPEVFAVLVMLSMVLMAGPAWAPMPFCLQALHLADQAGIKVNKAAVALGVTIVLGVAVALPATIYLGYSEGAPATAGRWTNTIARWPFEQGVEMQYRLQSLGVREEVAAASPWGRLRWTRPDPGHLIAFCLTLVAAIAVYICYMRIRGWPIHPIAFAFLAHCQVGVAPSLFLAGLVKWAAEKYGTATFREELKPLMIGLIAGELVAKLVPAVVGIVGHLL